MARLKPYRDLTLGAQPSTGLRKEGLGKKNEHLLGSNLAQESLAQE